MTKEQREEVIEMCKEISSQDNKGTQRPIYKVMSKTIEHCSEEESDGYKVWIGEDGLIGKDGEVDWKEYFDVDLSQEYIEEQLEDNAHIYHLHVKDVWIVWNCGFFFTEKAAKVFIERNRHNLSDPHIYVDHSYRNPEIKMIVDFMFNYSGMDLPHFRR